MLVTVGLNWWLLLLTSSLVLWCFSRRTSRTDLDVEAMSALSISWSHLSGSLSSKPLSRLPHDILRHFSQRWVVSLQSPLRLPGIRTTSEDPPRNVRLVSPCKVVLVPLAASLGLLCKSSSNTSAHIKLRCGWCSWISQWSCRHDWPYRSVIRLYILL